MAKREEGRVPLRYGPTQNNRVELFNGLWGTKAWTPEELSYYKNVVLTKPTPKISEDDFNV